MIKRQSPDPSLQHSVVSLWVPGPSAYDSYGSASTLSDFEPTKDVELEVHSEAAAAQTLAAPRGVLADNAELPPPQTVDGSPNSPFDFPQISPEDLDLAFGGDGHVAGSGDGAELDPSLQLLLLSPFVPSPPAADSATLASTVSAHGAAGDVEQEVSTEAASLPNPEAPHRGLTANAEESPYQNMDGSPTSPFDLPETLLHALELAFGGDGDVAGSGDGSEPGHKWFSCPIM
ncbi:hypothetical protein BESB_083480 [Besnoitia besnoiti]|uniref:Uncharacterized protein n=1 Tax=Besnoitia besnoiti TaxID=94643 RepID=A0A2A9M5D0_BESBE|nr:hypothetical protein BESB_083480 [Besnoitia besnoiti]PFH33149.1 hypothetical protein BESB_083480 [Besnoitia besnoiti]